MDPNFGTDETAESDENVEQPAAAGGTGRDKPLAHRVSKGGRRADGVVKYGEGRLPAAQHLTQNLSGARLSHKKTFTKKIARYYEILQKQRTHFETQHPGHVSPSEPVLQKDETLEQAEAILAEAYGELDVPLQALLSGIDKIRRIERRIHPQEIVRPAVMALAVSAPSTTWSSEVWFEGPFPNLAKMLETTFLRSFSFPDILQNRPRPPKRKKIKDPDVARGADVVAAAGTVLVDQGIGANVASLVDAAMSDAEQEPRRKRSAGPAP
jgi:hypothetical protein